MKVIVRKEEGYEMALYGLSLSFKDRKISFGDWWTKERFSKLQKTSEILYKKDGGHNKFLESIVVWVDIEAPRGFWQEYDTYRAGVTKQSDSTMHTIQNRKLDLDDFEKETDSYMVDRFNTILSEETDNFSSKKMLRDKGLQRVKWNLPEGFLQDRLVCLNYKVLRNMFNQRFTHRLEQWQTFISEVYKQVEHPELLSK